MNMEQQVDTLRTEALALINAADSTAALESARVKFLGKSGAITALSEGMRHVAKEDSP